MSHIRVRKMIEGHHSFAGTDWWYAFGPEIAAFGEDVVKRFVARKQAAFSRLARVWNDELNTEWVCRVFWAAKMILAASLMLESLEYARRKNLKICVPYLQYYSLLYSLKALVVVLPNQQWDGGALIKQTHTKTINIACDEVAKLDKTWRDNREQSPSVKSQVLRLKAFREFISYRAPSSGGRLDEYGIDVLPLCKVPAELAQMVSEVLEKALGKHLPTDYRPRLLKERLASVFLTRIGEEQFYDEEDAYRIRYLFRKYPVPTNILHVMSEGHVEDFFGSWCDANQGSEVFNPDDNWRILFDVP